MLKETAEDLLAEARKPRRSLLKRTLISTATWGGIGIAVLAAGIAFGSRNLPATDVRDDGQTTEEASAKSEQLPFGYPEAKDAVVVLHNLGFSNGYSVADQDPLWTTYTVLPKNHRVHGAIPPRPMFVRDERVPESPGPNWLAHTGYQRGHMAPNEAIAECFGEEAQRECFRTTNMCPQAPEVNELEWEHWERHIRTTYSSEYGTIWVICGPIFTGESKRHIRCTIPDNFYLILARMENEGPVVMAVIVDPNIPGHPATSKLCSVADIESVTGITFLPKVDQSSLTIRGVHPVWN